MRLWKMGIRLAFVGIGFLSLAAAGRLAAEEPNREITRLLDEAQNEFAVAMESYAAGDLVGAEQSVVKTGRLIYSVEAPENGEGKRYADMTTRLALLTIRINRLLHESSLELEPEKFTMPVPYNTRVENQIDHFLFRGREEFARWLRRSGRYVPILRKRFEAAGLPGDLVYLALIESGFNPRNRSIKHAVGLFQFIKDTAEMVGLKEDSWVDERRHPEKAADAAVKHLKSLYQEFKDWDLALAAYNAGSGRVWQAIKAQGVRDYWQLALPPETEAYVPKFYATLIIAKEPVLFGFNPDYEEEEGADEVEVPGSVDLTVVAAAAGVTLTVVANLNPELTKGCTPPGPENYNLRLPAGTAKTFLENFANIPDQQKFLTADELSRRKLKDIYFVYTIKNGDSLFKIAKKNNTSVAKIKRFNPSLAKSKYIRPGQKIRIYRGE